jgi:hypothetical protein
MLRAQSREIHVADLGSLRSAVANAVPGTTIMIAPGQYAGGLYATDLHGTQAAPIVMRAADPKRPPTFTGAIQFQAVSYFEIHELVISGVSGNAIGIDDKGIREKPAHHITIQGLNIVDVPGPGSNGIKLAGVDDFRIEDCLVSRWGGCAVDMVGCHKGRIESCRFSKGGGVGIQAKGASSAVTIRRCAFSDYGGRGVNLGGSTGIPFFRPPLEQVPSGARYEAKGIRVEGCAFTGGDAPFAFAGADSCTVRFNTIYCPQKWAVRILQETSTPDFVSCRGGRFEDNIVVFRSDHWYEGGVNVGPGTAPTSFGFARNWWYCLDKPDQSRPTLPSLEEGGAVGRDPMLDGTDLHLKPVSPAKKSGADAFPAGG